MAALLVLAFLAHVIAHGACLRVVFSDAGRTWPARLAALIVPPLAPLQAYRSGGRRAAFAWGGTFLAYLACVPLFA